MGAVLVSIPALAATVSGPKISVAPKSLNFGLVKLGGTSTQTLTILNTGTEDLTLNPISVTGTNASEFGPGSYLVTVPAGGSITVDVTFSPQLLPFGKKSALMGISSNDPKKPLLNVKLMGQAPAPVISASPMSVNLGETVTGARSLPRTVTIRNTGVSDLNISSISITGTDEADFAQTNDCPDALATGETCSVDVTFRTDSDGKKGAVLEIASNAPKKPLLNIKLMGIGMNPGGSSFSGSDLAGEWENHYLNSSAGSSGWGRGNVTVAADGAFTLQDTNSAGESGSANGTLTINSAGEVTIDCPDCDPGDKLFMDLGKTFMARANNKPGDAGEIEGIAKKADSYSQDDLTGTWHLQGITVGSYLAWHRSELTIAADGSSAISETWSDGSSFSGNGNMAVSADGAVTIAQSNDPLLQINMDAGKTLMVATHTNDAQNGVYEFTVATKQGASYSTADMAGTWNFLMFEADASNPAVSGVGTIKIGKDGTVNGSVTMTSGNTDAISGKLSLSSTGQLTVTGTDSTGYLDAGKTVAVMTEAHESGVGMVVLTKKAD